MAHRTSYLEESYAIGMFLVLLISKAREVLRATYERLSHTTPPPKSMDKQLNGLVQPSKASAEMGLRILVARTKFREIHPGLFQLLRMPNHLELPGNQW